MMKVVTHETEVSLLNRLTEAESPKSKRKLGFLASQEVKLNGFFDPVLDAQIAGDFYGSDAPMPLQPNQLTDRAHGRGE